MDKTVNRVMGAVLGVVVLVCVAALGYAIAVDGIHVNAKCYGHQTVQRVSYEHDLTENYVHFATPTSSDVIVHSDDTGATTTRVGDAISYCIPDGGGTAYAFRNDSLSGIISLLSVYALLGAMRFWW